MGRLAAEEREGCSEEERVLAADQGESHSEESDIGRLAAEGGERHSENSGERGPVAEQGESHAEKSDEGRLAAEKGERHSEHSGERGPAAEEGESHSVLAEVEGGYVQRHSITKQFFSCCCTS